MVRVIGWVLWIFTWEVAMFGSLLRWLVRRPSLPKMATPFSYTSPINLVLGAFIAVGVIETVAVHVLLPWDTARLIADIVSIYGLLWMCGYAASLRIHPHYVLRDDLVVRSGHAKIARIPLRFIDEIVATEVEHPGARGVVVSGTDVLTATFPIGSRTNIELRLSRSVPTPTRDGIKDVSVVRFWADDRDRLVSMLPTTAAATR